MSRTLNLAEARAALSRLVEEVANGEEIIIAKAGRPLARLVALADRPERVIGVWKGQGWMADDFDVPLPEDMLDAFEGSDG
ncbi:MAG: type II toxin-antitoxin system prevent-host-death family antitoxin [Myxococcota bacterium]